MARSLQEWHETVRPMLAGINRYNPENIETLEQYAQFQAESNEYDFEANLTLMKLYQFKPARSNASIATLILLKALTHLPSTDFVLLKSVLSPTLQRDEGIVQIVTLHSLLESCRFKEFWLAVGEVEESVQNVPSLHKAIRNYICDIVDVSYQTVPLELLQGYLGGLEGSVLDELASLRGWQISGDTVHIRNQEEYIKPKKILAKIEFDSVSGILATAAAAAR